MSQKIRTLRCNRDGNDGWGQDTGSAPQCRMMTHAAESGAHPDVRFNRAGTSGPVLTTMSRSCPRGNALHWLSGPPCAMMSYIIAPLSITSRLCIVARWGDRWLSYRTYIWAEILMPV